MATTFKSLGAGDITTTITLLHESIPITGSIVSGTYSTKTTAVGSAFNIKTYEHGMFQSVFDYPFLSSSANHIFDITAGYAADSTLSAASNSQNAKKINIYNQMCQVFIGYDETGQVRQFDKDGNIIAGGDKLKECLFINFSRILTKDEIKKGTFTMEFGVSGAYVNDDYGGATFNKRIKVRDLSGSNGYFVNSPAGEYGLLFATSSTDSSALLYGEVLGGVGAGVPCGLIFYQAGIAVLSGSTFLDYRNGGLLSASSNEVAVSLGSGFTKLSGFNAITGSTIDTIADGVRQRLYNISFNNTTELNSTLYFCRANNTEFNYSSNPTYLST